MQPARDETPAWGRGPAARRPKILMLVSELEDYTIAFTNGVAAELPVVLGVPRRRYETLAGWFDPAVDLRLLDWPRHRSISNLRFVRDIVQLVAEERPDVVHLLSHTTLWLNLAAPFWRAPELVTTVHDVEVHPGDRDTRAVPEVASSLMVRQSGHVVVHGDTLRQRAAERFGKDPSRVHVLSHPSMDRYRRIAERLPPHDAPRDTFDVLLFGRIFAYKGLSDLVAAAGLLAGRVPNLRITIAGRGDDPWQLRDKMADPAVFDVRHRYIEDEEVARLFRDTDLVVLPYAEASQSGVLNVAATFGKPIVATDVGELGPTVRDADMGLVTSPRDPAALADAIERLANAPDERARLGANARAWADGPNSPAAVSAAAARLYREICDRRRLPEREQGTGRRVA